MWTISQSRPTVSKVHTCPQPDCLIVPFSFFLSIGIIAFLAYALMRLCPTTFIIARGSATAIMHKHATATIHKHMLASVYLRATAAGVLCGIRNGVHGGGMTMPPACLCAALAGVSAAARKVTAVGLRARRGAACWGPVLCLLLFNTC